MSRGFGSRRERDGGSYSNRTNAEEGGIDKMFEKMIRSRLEEFRNGSEMELKLEPMNREQRKFTHHIAGRLDLKSHSTGSEGNRQITISRRTYKPSLVSCMGAIETKPIKLNGKQVKAVTELIGKYPIDQRHIENHLRSGSAARRSHNSRSINTRMVEPMLVPPPTNEHTEMRRFRETLPTFKLRQKILHEIRTHKVTLVTGGTGCGKTTQVPQFILEEATAEGRALRIICTQPRRLPAIAVADRVAKERNERLGATVGYHIRLEQKTSSQTVLTYCTSGVLLRMLTIDDVARSISHILLDEIHEREQNTDYLLIALKQALKTREDLKVILMSATMEDNLDTFIRYFGGIDVAHVNIPSRLYHVEKFFLSEVLALTGYKPPPSLFGGTFSSTGFGQFHSQSVKNFDSFPHVDEFRSDALDEKSFARRNPKHRLTINTSELISVRTAPNLGALMSNGIAHQMVTPCRGAPFERCFATTAATAESTNASTATLVTSASTSALQSHGAQNMQPTGDEYEKLAQTLADTNWNEINYAELSRRPNDGTHVFSISPSECAYSTNNNVANMTGQSGAGTDSTEDGPDVVELPDSDEELARIQANNAAAAQRAYAVQMEQMGISQQPNYMSHPPPDWNLHPHNPYSAPPFCTSQFGCQQQQPYHFVPPQHVAVSYSQPVGQQPQYGMSVPMQSAPMMYCAQAPTSSQQPQQQTAPHFGAAQPPRFYVSQESFDGSAPSTQNCSTHPFPGGYAFPHAYQNGFALTHHHHQQQQDHVASLSTLPSRPSSFDPAYVDLLRRTKLNSLSLIEDYLNCGGQQWTDGVDPDLTVAVIKYCMDSPVSGSILVFLPGYEDILTIRESAMTELKCCCKRPVIFMLHSQMNSQDQQKVFDPVPVGSRKVILSTNIAEASLTIDDVVFVIDCGKVKEKTYDHSTRINQLKISWIAKSNAEQRAGRAGRCRAGYCFRLYSVDDHERMNPTQIAEMKRAAIHDVCLHAKMFAPENISVKKFLSLAPEPPSPQAVEWSLEFLEQLGALYSDRSAGALTFDGRSSLYGRERREPELTELGRHIAQLPLEPQLARLLLFGIALKCFNPVVTLVAALSHRDPFILPLGEERAAALTARDEFGRCDYSDHLMLLRAFNAYSRTAQGQRQWHFCKTKFLSPNTMKMIAGIRRQLLIELRRLRMLPASCHAFDDPDLNRYSSSWPMVQAAIVAGSYPGIGFVRAGNKLRKIRTSTDSSATLHPGCIIKRQVLAPSRRSEMINQYTTGREDKEPIIEYLAFQELSKIDEGLTLRTVTVVPPLSVVLFAGAIRLEKETVKQFGVGEEMSSEVASIVQDDDEDDGGLEESDCILEMEPWLAFKGKYPVMQAVLKLRFKLMSYFLEVMKNPGRNETDEDRLLLSTLEQVLSEDHRRSRFYSCTDLQGPRSRQFNSIRSEEWILDHGHPQRQQSVDEDHVQKLRRAQSSKDGSHTGTAFTVTRFDDDFHLRSNGFAESRIDHSTANGGSFRQSASAGNFRLSFENRANNAHQSFGGCGPGFSRWNDTVSTNAQNRANDRKAPFSACDMHRRWDARSGPRRNMEFGNDGGGNRQARDDFYGGFAIHSKTSPHQQCSRFEQRDDDGTFDEEQVPEDPCSTTNSKEWESKRPASDEDDAGWYGEEEGEGASHQSSTGGFNGVRVPAGRYRTSKRSNGESWYAGSKEFTRRVNFSHSAGAPNGEPIRNCRYLRNGTSRSTREVEDGAQRDCQPRERPEEGTEGKRYFEYYNKNSKSFFGNRGGGRREALSRRRAPRGRDAC